MEIALWVIGSSLLGLALGATLLRWSYQAEQEQLLRSAAASQLVQPGIENGSEPTSVPGSQTSPVTGPDPSGDRGEASLPPLENDEAAQAEPLAPSPSAPASAPAPPERSEQAIDPGLIGRIEIPRLGIEAIVRDGDDDATLRRAVGLIRGTARPGEGGNTGLAGHRDTFFRALRRIEMNDRIRLFVPPHTYEYRVDSLRVVEPSEVSVLDSNGTEELTLVTCYPFRFIGPAPDRFIVKATRIR